MPEETTNPAEQPTPERFFRVRRKSDGRWMVLTGNGFTIGWRWCDVRQGGERFDTKEKAVVCSPDGVDCEVVAFDIREVGVVFNTAELRT